MSELKEIYKFLFDYFKIYKETYSHSTSKWKLNDLNNAFKWSNGIEEFYKKINNRKCLSSLIENVKLILKHWNLNEEMCEDLLKNATKNIKKSLLSNKNLSDELKSYILDSFRTDQTAKEAQQKDNLNDQYLTLYENEIDKICLKLSSFKNDPYLLDVLFDYTLNHQNNIEFVAKLFERLKNSNYETFKNCFLRLLNKKYNKLFMNDESFKLFQLEQDDEELIKAYFSYLVFMFTELIEEFSSNKKDINDPNNVKGHSYDLIKLTDHFENAIKISNSTKFIKIIQNRANLNEMWNFLINQLKLKYIKKTDLYLDALEFDEE